MKKFFKSISCLLLAMLMGFTVACGDGDTSGDNDDGTNTEQPGTGDEGGSGNEGGSGGETTKAQYTLDETVQKLSKTEYADASMTDDNTYGLSDISAVGVVESKLNEELYPIELSGEYEVIEFSSYSNAATDYQKLLDAFTYAKELNAAGKKAIISMPQNGVINVNASLSGDNTFAYNISGYNGLYIQGNGCKVVVSYDNFAFRGFINVAKSQDVHINDLIVDYETPTAVSGLISDIDLENATATVEIDPSFNETVNRIVENGATQEKTKLWSYVEFDAITGAAKQGGNFCTANETQIVGYTIQGNETEGYEIVVQFGDVYKTSLSTAALGEYANLAFSMYVYNAFVYDSCENVYMENVTLYTTPGMGVVGRRTTNIYVNRMQIAVPENSARLMTTTADGFHFAECYGEVKITNSLIEYTHDDALNIKSGYYYALTAMDARAKTFTITQKTESISKPDVGNVIEFYDSDTFEKLGYGTVKEVLKNVGESSYTIEVEESLTRQGAASWNTAKVVATNVSKSAKFTFTNNIVRNKRNRGLLIQVREATISNNAFFNVGHGSISIHSSLDVFNEATIPNNITIENNKFVNNNYLLSLAGDIYVFARSSSLAPVGTIKDIKIRNNFIAKNGNAGISLQSCSGSVVENNLLYDNSRVNAGELYDCALELNNSGDLLIKGNYVYNTLDSATYAGIISGGLTDTTTITLDGNINLAYQEIEVETTTTEVAKLVSEVAIDGDLSDWATQGTSVSMLGHSLATGAAIDPIQYQDVFDVNMCKVAWNDNGIYVAFDIKDDTYDFKTVNNFWTGDCFEMFVSSVLTMPNADMQLYRNKGDVAQFACVPTWTDGWTFAAERTSDAIMAGKAQIQAKCVKTATGYCGEMYLPFSLMTQIKDSVDNGNEIAMAFVFADNDRDDIGRKRLQVSNVPHFVEAWKTKTAKMPLFKFVETVSEVEE